MRIFEPLAAVSVLSIGQSVRQKEADTEECGIIDTAAPVSTRNDVLSTNPLDLRASSRQRSNSSCSDIIRCRGHQ